MSTSRNQSFVYFTLPGVLMPMERLGTYAIPCVVEQLSQFPNQERKAPGKCDVPGLPSQQESDVEEAMVCWLLLFRSSQHKITQEKLCLFLPPVWGHPPPHQPGLRMMRSLSLPGVGSA